MSWLSSFLSTKSLRLSQPIVSTFTPDINIQGEFNKMKNILSNIRFNSVDVEDKGEDEQISSVQNNNKNYGTTG